MPLSIDPISLRNDFFANFRDEYKKFAKNSSISRDFQCLRSFLKKNKDAYFSYDINDEDVDNSIHEFFEIVEKDSNVVEQVYKIIKYIKRETPSIKVSNDILNSIEKINNSNTDSDFHEISNEDRIIRHIVLFYYKKLKKESFWAQPLLISWDITEKEWMRHCESKQSDLRREDPQRYFIVIEQILEDSTTETNSIITIINDMLNPTIDSTKLNWFLICNYLRIRNSIRNEAEAHTLDKKIFHPNDRISVVKFILYTYITTCLALRKCLAIKKAFKKDEENIRWNIHFFLSYTTAQKPEVRVIMSDGTTINSSTDKSPLQYTLDATSKYQIIINGKEFYNEKLLTNGVVCYGKWDGKALLIESNVTNDPHGAETVLVDIAGSAKTIATNTYELNTNIKTGFDQVNKGLVTISDKIDETNWQQKRENEIGNASSNKEDVLRDVHEIETIAKENPNSEKLAEIKDIADNLKKTAIDAVNKARESNNDKDLENAVKETKDAFYQAQVLLNNAKNIAAEIEKRTKRRKGFLVAVGVIAIIAIIGVVIFHVFFNNAPKPLTPAELAAKGDDYYRQQNSEEAGKAWKEAIEGFEKELEQNPNNDSIHIALAVMYMRGKGYYDLDKAIDHARQAKTERGRGLYAYLLTRIGDYEKAREIYAKADFTDDEYLQLSKVITDLYGANEKLAMKRTGESINLASTNLEGLAHKNQEAMLEYASMAFHGVPDNEKDYFILPDVPQSMHLLDDIVDSISPFAMAVYSETFLMMQDYRRFFNLGWAALNCGMTEVAPILRAFIVECGDNFPNKNGFLEKLEKWTYKNSIGNDYADFIQMQKKGDAYLNEMTKQIDDMVKRMKEQGHRDFYISPEVLEATQISLHLAVGDTIEATRFAMQKDDCKDSIAVSLYLRGIMYAKGYADTPIDTIISDSLINLAAERGYAEAIYTRLRRAPQISPKITRNKRGNNMVEVHIEYQDYFAELDDGTIVVIYRDLDKKVVPDTIWKKSPKIAAELYRYWSQWPDRQDEAQKYVQYCPFEYVALSRYKRFVPLKWEDGNDDKMIKKLMNFNTLLQDLRIGISTALIHGQPKIAKYLCYAYVKLAKPILEYRDLANTLHIYSQRIYDHEEMYSEQDTLDTNLAMDYPVYAY